MTTYELRELEEKANQGDAESQFRLGDYYQWDAPDAPISTEALKWYELSAENGFIGAQFTLGEFYFQGEGGYEKSYDKAFKWFKKAADSGDGMALWRVGSFYELGVGVEKDHEEAIKWYKRSAEEGYSTARVCLAFFILISYLTGDLKYRDSEREEFINRVNSFGKFTSQLTIPHVDRNYLETAKKYLEDALTDKNLEEGYKKPAEFFLSQIKKELSK